MPAPRLWPRAGGTVEPRLNASIRTSASASILSLCDILGSDEARTRLPCAPREVCLGSRFRLNGEGAFNNRTSSRGNRREQCALCFPNWGCEARGMPGAQPPQESARAAESLSATHGINKLTSTHSGDHQEPPVKGSLYGRRRSPASQIGPGLLVCMQIEDPRPRCSRATKVHAENLSNKPAAQHLVASPAWPTLGPWLHRLSLPTTIPQTPPALPYPGERE